MFGVAFDLHRCSDTEGMRCRKNIAFSSVGDRELQGSWSDTVLKVFGFLKVLERYEMQVGLFRKLVPQVQTTGPKVTLTPGGYRCLLWYALGDWGKAPVCFVWYGWYPGLVWEE